MRVGRRSPIIGYLDTTSCIKSRPRNQSASILRVKDARPLRFMVSAARHCRAVSSADTVDTLSVLQEWYKFHEGYFHEEIEDFRIQTALLALFLIATPGTIYACFFPADYPRKLKRLELVAIRLRFGLAKAILSLEA